MLKLVEEIIHNALLPIFDLIEYMMLYIHLIIPLLLLNSFLFDILLFLLMTK